MESKVIFTEAVERVDSSRLHSQCISVSGKGVGTWNGVEVTRKSEDEMENYVCITSNARSVTLNWYGLTQLVLPSRTATSVSWFLLCFYGVILVSRGEILAALGGESCSTGRKLWNWQLLFLWPVTIWNGVWIGGNLIHCKWLDDKEMEWKLIKYIVFSERKQFNGTQHAYQFFNTYFIVMLFVFRVL